MSSVCVQPTDVKSRVKPWLFALLLERGRLALVVPRMGNPLWLPYRWGKDGSQFSKTPSRRSVIPG